MPCLYFIQQGRILLNFIQDNPIIITQLPGHCFKAMRIFGQFQMQGCVQQVKVKRIVEHLLEPGSLPGASRAEKKKKSGQDV
ncbi:hypothetical protein SAMN05660653_00439 [Desulfonatronum thiosulfatophilum]|uniref:Uncharacterized protein n=1 Tax=Desulfonatronum thiosulfatophilum TaxID=617002 RepID=A0A1G6AKM2_9BACT|nr:hypothetical protein [Desulfonatronum thiosulfatophilum]SDB08964.1 hypothetical protein SAMN05660653_00439 [Desulfonatronum thiosulfatophilum]